MKFLRKMKLEHSMWSMGLINIKCFYCEKEACAKVGTSKGNLFRALFGGKCWNKSEVYVCKNHYIIRTTKVPNIGVIK